MPNDPENARRWLDLLRSKNAIIGNAVVAPDKLVVSINFMDGSQFNNRDNILV